jgi:hypothetical protein
LIGGVTDSVPAAIEIRDSASNIVFGMAKSLQSAARSAVVRSDYLHEQPRERLDLPTEIVF